MMENLRSSFFNNFAMHTMMQNKSQLHKVAWKKGLLVVGTYGHQKKGAPNLAQGVRTLELR